MTRKPIYHADDDGEPFSGDELYEECEVCHQEFRGVCPITSADCPYADQLDDEEEDDDLPDFEDVENLDELIGDDEEVEKIIEEEVEIPVEDLMDDETVAEEDEEEGPSKTVEELEAEAEEAARQAKAKRGGKASPAPVKAAKTSAKKSKK